eukprot:10967634-Ditylum_brightwellii.AAC.1
MQKIIDKLKYTGSYQDDGLAIVDGQHTTQQVIKWLCNFQLQVDELVGGEFFHFTAKLWRSPGDERVPTKEEIEADEEMTDEAWKKWEERVTVVTKEHIPYLDMKMHWEGEDLQLLVYNK